MRDEDFETVLSLDSKIYPMTRRSADSHKFVPRERALRIFDSQYQAWVRLWRVDHAFPLRLFTHDRRFPSKFFSEGILRAARRLYSLSIFWTICFAT